MNTKHIPNLELCQELDRLCKENNITPPETEFYWDAVAGGSIEIVKAPSTSSNITNKERCHDELSNISIPAPLVSEQGEWLGKVSGKDFLNSYLEVMDLFIFQIDKVQMSHNLMTDPDIGISMINYLIAEEIITTL